MGKQKKLKRKNKVKELANAHNASNIAVFAQMTGLSQRTVYNIFKPTKGLSYDTIQAIVYAFPDASLESFIYVERRKEADGKSTTPLQADGVCQSFCSQTTGLDCNLISSLQAAGNVPLLDSTNC